MDVLVKGMSRELRGLVEALNDLTFSGCDFSFEPEQPEQSFVANAFSVQLPGDEVVVRRLQHYARWVLQNRKPCQFELFIFTPALGAPAVSRTISLARLSASSVNISVENIKPIAHSQFNDALDQRLLNSLNDVVLVSEAEPFDQPGPRVIYVNKAFERMTGYCEADIIGKTPRILQHQDTTPDSLRNIRQALDRWESVTQVVYNAKKNGETFYSELDINPVQDETGWYTYWVAVQRDVTEQHIEQENRQRLLEAAPEATVCIDQNNLITYFSKKAEYLWGLRAEDVIGESLDKLIPKPAQAVHRHYVEAHRKAKKAPVCTDVRILNAEGKERQCRMHIAQMTLHDNSIGYTIFARDYTDELRKDRTLAEAQKTNLMQSRLASLGELAAGVGHEINNPLQLIQGQLDLMAFKNKDLFDQNPALTTSLSVISDASHRIKSIVDSLRSMSRVNADVDPNSVEEVSLICMQTVQMIKQLSSQNQQVAIEVRAPSEPIYARIDAVSLKQIMVNLINNALDALATNTEKRVIVDIRRDADKCFIAVTDNGPGIPQQIKARVFDPFFTTKDVGKGTGLGLSIINTLVAAYGGEITLASEENQGTTFTVKLWSPDADEGNQNNTSKKSLNILVVDDEPEILGFIQAYLLHQGHTVTISCNPVEVIEELASNAFDLVITDYSMPGKTGDELLAQLRDKRPSGSFKAIIMSGYLNFNAKDKNKAPANLLADAVLKKPFTLDALSEQIKTLFPNH